MSPPAEKEILEALRPILDPELAVSIVDLGLVYGIDVSADGEARVTYSLTTRGCPMGESISGAIERVVAGIPGVRGVDCCLVWDPAWNVGMINEEGRRRLGVQ